MMNMCRTLAMAALSMRTDLTPGEQQIYNQFLRGNSNLAD